MTTKRCPKCGDNKSLYLFGKDKTTKSGLYPYCKSCKNKTNKAWILSNPEIAKAVGKAYRAANPDKCAAIKKAWDLANPDKKSASDKAYRDANKERKAATNKAWYGLNPVRRARVSAAWRDANRERIAAVTSAYRKANPEKVRARIKEWSIANPDRCRTKATKWQSANKDKINALTMRRRAMKLNATPVWVDNSKIAAFYAEAKKLTGATGIDHHVDHVVPLRSKLVCGLHCEANLQVIPGRENSAKGNRHWPDMP